MGQWCEDLEWESEFRCRVVQDVRDWSETVYHVDHLLPQNLPLWGLYTIRRRIEGLAATVWWWCTAVVYGGGSVQRQLYAMVLYAAVALYGSYSMLGQLYATAFTFRTLC
ncbi:unnamed protein product [Lupinus luteus]|uniref:Uncharacterized protein n=1 Tax=Lupinus luteus TaxID=3873 RepID=A0AAV1VSY2_LUPLU